MSVITTQSDVEYRSDTYLADEEAAFDAMPQPIKTTDLALYNKLLVTLRKI